MKMVNSYGKGETLMYFDSITSLANLQVPEINLEKWRDTTTDRDSRWLGVDGGHPRVRELVELYGWEYGVKKGLDKLGTLKAPKLPSIRRKRVKGNKGKNLNINRMYSGKFNTMWTAVKKTHTDQMSVKKTNINLLIDISTSASVGSDSFFWRGALGILLARALIESGRSVRILAVAGCRGYATDSTNQGANYLAMAVQIKDYNEPLELNRMFAMSSLAGFYRHYFFKSILSQPYRINGNLGYPTAIELDYFESILDKNTVIMVENVWSEEAAKNKAEHILKEFGG